MSDYTPIGRNRAILDAAMDHILSVPYQPSLRWVFYRLLQQSLYAGKKDYSKFKSLTSAARKNFYNGWNPDTLVDGGREVIKSDHPTTRDQMIDLLPHYVGLSPELFADQPCIPFLLFEADTMSGQFEHFAPWSDFAALRGDASIPHKWNIAQRCNELTEIYDLPVHVLYFGDYDPKGLVIPESAMADIRAWADNDLGFTRVGINSGDAARFNMQEKFEKPGTYEWEALEHDDAGLLLREGLESAIEYLRSA